MRRTGDYAVSASRSLHKMFRSGDAGRGERHKTVEASRREGTEMKKLIYLIGIFVLLVAGLSYGGITTSVRCDHCGKVIKAYKEEGCPVPYYCLIEERLPVEDVTGDGIVMEWAIWQGMPLDEVFCSLECLLAHHRKTHSEVIDFDLSGIPPGSEIKSMSVHFSSENDECGPLMKDGALTNMGNWACRIKQIEERLEKLECRSSK